jgi:hypothetical protein
MMIRRLKLQKKELVFFVVFWDWLLLCGPCCHAGLEIRILLPLLPEFWSYRSAPPCLDKTVHSLCSDIPLSMTIRDKSLALIRSFYAKRTETASILLLIQVFISNFMIWHEGSNSLKNLSNNLLLMKNQVYTRISRKKSALLECIQKFPFIH